MAHKRPNSKQILRLYSYENLGRKSKKSCQKSAWVHPRTNLRQFSVDNSPSTILRRQFSVDNSPPTIHRRKIHRGKIHRRKIHRRKIHRRKIHRRKIRRRKIRRRKIVG